LCVPAGLTAPTPGHISLYHNNGDSTFSRASAGSLTSQAGYFGWGEWVDYDNDGFVDLLISNIADLDVGGKNVLFRNNGDGTFTSAAAGAVTSDSLGTWGLIWGDYDNDGFMDLFVVSHFASSLNRLYHNERNGTFTRVLTNIVATDRWPSSGGNGAAWADYDNDGFSDLFVIADSDTLNRLYHNSGNGTFTRVTSGPMLSHSPGGVSNGCSWGDYDNDGYIDLFVSAYGGRNQLFHNNGNGTFTQILSGSPANDGGPGVIYVAPSWVDYDNDGFVDLFVAGGSTDTRPGSNLLYHNNGNSNAWLEVKCVGTVSNRAAIGARVRALATIAGKRFWQTREIKQGGGHNSMPLVAHFGLGDATNADVLRIEWPSGIVQEFQGVASTQIVTVTEPARLAASATSGAPQFTLKGGLGFRYDVEVSENLRNWTTLGTLTVTNARAAVSITDADPPASGHRFYRALQVGQ